MKYALDTNTIIHLLRGNSVVRVKRDKAEEEGADFIIPPYVNFEIRRGFLYKPAIAKEKSYQELCNIVRVGEMTADVWEQAAIIYADLRKAGQTIDDGDLIIAAFCVVNGYILVTVNTKHFENIDGLQIINWVE